MPFVSIRIVKEVIEADPAGKKADIAAKVSKAISDASGLPEADVSVVFEEVAEVDWFVGPNRVKELRAGS